MRARALASAGKDAHPDIPMKRFANTRYQRLDSGPASSAGRSNEANFDSPDLELDKDIDDYEDSHDFPLGYTHLGRGESHATAALLKSGKSLALGVPGDERRFWFQRSHVVYNPHAIATQSSVFDDPDTLEEYRPGDDWENIHRFDPDERWSWGEEHRLIKKIDRKIMLFAAVMFMALELDRSNISQALTDNFLGDLGMTTNGELNFLSRLSMVLNKTRLQLW